MAETLDETDATSEPRSDCAKTAMLRELVDEFHEYNSDASLESEARDLLDRLGWAVHDFLKR